MRRRFALALLMSALLLPASACTRGDPVTAVRGDDPDVTAAIARARALLPHFWQVHANPLRGENGFALKVRITDAYGIEHIWTKDVSRVDGVIKATINNDPAQVRSVRLDERVTIQETDISDWLYRREGKTVGNFTVRAMFKLMPADEVARYQRELTEP